MLVSTINFEIHNFTTHTSETFMVENTVENQEMIFTHSYTRNIKFMDMFDFEFARKNVIPKFILFGATVADSFFENELVMELDETDEMVGSF